MGSITFYGIEGQQYDNIKEAWQAFYENIHGEKQIPKEVYHQELRAFIAGTISGINIMSVKFNQLAPKNISIEDKIARAIMATLNDAMAHAKENF